MQMSEASLIAINISNALKLGIYAKKAHCKQSWSVSIFQMCNLKTTSNLSPPCKRYKFPLVTSQSADLKNCEKWNVKDGILSFDRSWLAG